jgi:hypothetical protein
MSAIGQTNDLSVYRLLAESEYVNGGIEVIVVQYFKGSSRNIDWNRNKATQGAFPRDNLPNCALNRRLVILIAKLRLHFAFFQASSTTYVTALEFSIGGGFRMHDRIVKSHSDGYMAVSIVTRH